MAPRRDVRPVALAATALAIALAGTLTWLAPGRTFVDAGGEGVVRPDPDPATRGAALARLADARVAVPPIDPRVDPHGHVVRARQAEIAARFEQAVVMLHARRHEEAVTALHRVLELAPQLPEAHVNMGFALLGLERPAAARDFFEGALALRREQANAYFGLGMAHEALGEIEAARGAMRTYLHLAPEDDAFVRKARAALWEWESRGARGANARANPPAR